MIDGEDCLDEAIRAQSYNLFDHLIDTADTGAMTRQEAIEVYIGIMAVADGFEQQELDFPE